ncbi:DEAD/DEAH box helicase [Pseudobacteriovorax antillogorgiicola]|uniref:DNA repair protein RadD n=1 Tax=Pseudobacteriovorax antillogorgiicola TaxID=1513793 RepID=A0A1Y6CG72_9BACT|nr:DEAD/DEAH box helicase [Pseudobacteriovorax antillogorgiicola]TCS47596.1 DNA repair protein RadD [Pseudobacteriovorax antillogorgiicola]SMF60168.1 DNA repair protein RadD [Pseudobacteriovorax antillogorgiicola]
MYSLRPYQTEAVSSVIAHFRKTRHPALVVLPTGAGKSLVIAELARMARGRVLCLAHVKELVEQNHGKYESYDLEAGIFAAGLGRKDQGQKVIFGSIQSVARAKDEFFQDFNLLIVDECHRISLDEKSQYLQVIRKMQRANPSLCILGLTATPYRLGMGWIFEYHYRGFVGSREPRFFKHCVFELSLRYMIDHKYLTPPIRIDAPVACYDFSQLRLSQKTGTFKLADIENCLREQNRVTPGIVGHIVSLSQEREAVMIFTSSVAHAKEILSLLPSGEAALVVGDTSGQERDRIIHDFKQRQIKFLVNVSVLTTGFDAPHVDLIALLRPTESVSLFQQIVGRGLRLSPGKKDCLVLDYTGLAYDLFAPEIDDPRPSEDTELVKVPCPECGFENQFWGRVDDEGQVMEHFGRKCKGAHENPHTLEIETCSFRFRFKICDACGAENDIAARQCHSCKEQIVDVDSRLKKAMELRDAHVMRPDTMMLRRSFDKKKRERLEVAYFDVDAQALKEYYYLSNSRQAQAFYYNFVRMHIRNPGATLTIGSVDEAINSQEKFRMPLFVIARKTKYFWEVREKIF